MCREKVRSRRLCLGECLSLMLLAITVQLAHSCLWFRYLLLVLMDAERAWSYAMQLKQEANTEPRKRFHLLSRLRKAVKHAEELERLCESNRVDAKTKLEAQVSALTSALPYCGDQRRDLKDTVKRNRVS